MPDNKPIPGTLELVYVPDTYTDTERQEGASWPLGSGFYDVVLVANDARIVLHRIKAGAIDKAFAVAKSKKESQAQQPDATTTASASTTTTTSPSESPPPSEQPSQGNPATPQQ